MKPNLTTLRSRPVAAALMAALLILLFLLPRLFPWLDPELARADRGEAQRRLAEAEAEIRRLPPEGAVRPQETLRRIAGEAVEGIGLETSLGPGPVLHVGPARWEALAALVARLEARGAGPSRLEARRSGTGTVHAVIHLAPAPGGR